MNQPKNLDSSIEQVNIKEERGISPLWILPLLALCLGGWLVYSSLMEAGQRIQIYFEDAQGLMAGRTTIRYQGLEVGMVKNITLSKDLSNIYVDADIYPEASDLLKENTQFWLVKPQASLTGISGLDALVSGNYIAILPGSGAAKTKFTALANSPAIQPNTTGLSVTLRSKDLGSISVGSKIYYKKIPIGEVYNFKLDHKTDNVRIKALIEEQYAHLITSKSRFWNASGIGANIGFNGVDVQFESLSALIGGAIAVDSPDDGKAIENGKEFQLYSNIKTAGRGIPIKITLPDNNQISPNGSAIMYRGLEIGQINSLKLSDDKKDIIASATVEPAFTDYLNDGSRFVLEEAKLGLSGVENIGNLVRGNFLTLVPGTGERSREFTAIRKPELIKQDAKALTFSLYADRSFGLTPDTTILYKGIKVGSITHVALVNDRVKFDAMVFEKYKHLIKSNNKFFVSGSVSAELTDSGLNIDVPPTQALISGSISFTSEGKGYKQKSYTLFKNSSLAELAQFKTEKSTELTLFSTELPPITKNSPILYRNLVVGKVTDFNLGNDGVNIKINIEKQYAHLIQADTVFWNYSGVNVEASLSGVNIQAAPLMSMIRGGIGFDNIQGVENKLGKKWKLYSNLSEAQEFGKIIAFTAKDSNAIDKGTQIKYKGVSVGEVSKITPNFSSDNVYVQARIYPEYVDQIAVAGSHFWVVEPSISLAGAENLDTLLGSYIQVTPGSGKAKTQFTLSDQPQGDQFISYTLEALSRGSVKVGTPILFREIEVGEVTDVRLGDLSDRIIITIGIHSEFAYLVRENSVFWNVSGVNMSIGLSGAKVQAGTVDSILRGGIAFSTPDDETLKPQAKAHKSYLLHKTAEEDWALWNAAIPNPNK
ncbi:MCE family protein [Aliivibrio fischeri]|uniref:MlaD family protein n=1 Tax=Aliivibrio fischeri TaxID=668 RepID=UPI0007C4EF0C|nr:MlaD family protein [Aliivibrio fischeri]MCE7576422.1 MlaD family protein [Aliivibrio fischeri]MCE7588712.1 MlaD family protein [Aliivibrio fischeri]MUK93503.1 MCE family protein [Aliivibrio fischeri]MUL16251.1 MCE family protein [Aliivibrio fischeri]